MADLKLSKLAIKGVHSFQTQISNRTIIQQEWLKLKRRTKMAETTLGNPTSTQEVTAKNCVSGLVLLKVWNHWGYSAILLLHITLQYEPRTVLWLSSSFRGGGKKVFKTSLLFLKYIDFFRLLILH